MPDYIDDRVLVLQRDADGKFIHHESISLKDLQNTVPRDGDRIALLIDEGGLSLMEVVGRYFLRFIEERTGNEWLTWFLMVEEVDPDFRDDLDDALMEVYKQERHWQAPPPQSEQLDRPNRDPEYWTHERKMILQREREARLGAMGKAGEE